MIDISSEWACVGSLYRAGAYAIHRARKDGLKREDFYSESAGLVFQTLCDIADDNGAVDRPTLRKSIAQKFVDYGEASLDTSLTKTLEILFGEDWSAPAAYSHAAKVRDASLSRQAQAELSAALEELRRSGKPARDMLVDINSKLSSLLVAPTQEAGRMSSIVPELIRKMRERYDQGAGVAGLTTGFDTLDSILDGLLPGTLHIIAGKTSSGKSALTGNIACHIATYHKSPGIIFSLEMKREQLASRYIFSSAGVDRQDFRGRMMDEDKWNRIGRAAESIRAMPLIIEDSRKLSLQEMLGYLRVMRFQKECDFAVVDYTQLIRSPKRAQASREAEVAEIVSELGAVAMELEIPVIALSQLNDDGRTRESRSIENFAESLLVVEQKEDRKDPFVASKSCLEADLVVQKNRDGEVRVIPLNFYPRIVRFEEST